MATAFHKRAPEGDKTAGLYVRRNVTNGHDIREHFKAQGMGKMVQPGDMHVTVAHSKTPVDAAAAGQSTPSLTVPEDTYSRRVKPLGDKGALVMHFDSPELQKRHGQLKKAGAKWDFPSYQPHVTLTYDGSETDHAGIEPWSGPIDFGPEIHEPLDDGSWAGSIVEKQRRIIKVEALDKPLGLVFGFGIVSKVNGEDYYDLNVDRYEDGTVERVPEHIPEDAMLKAAFDWAKGERPGNDMHKGPEKGMYPFIFPLTTEIAKSLGITTEKTGMLVGFHPPADIFAKYASGEYTGFSIEGDRIDYVEHAA